jgi:NCS1 family nucleobase:cation symporter-1
MSSSSKLDSFSAFFPVFIPSLTAMIGFWSTLSLNMPDFTRFGRSQKEQAVGQAVALPSTMTVFAAMGVVVTSATTIIFGEAVWDPVVLVGRFESPIIVAIAMFTVVVATLSVNIAANVVSPANDFANAFPKKIDFKTGGLITGLIGIAMQPWKLLADPSGYIYTWLIGYSGGLGSIAGVLVVDYWLIRKTELVLNDLYRVDGSYRYSRGWNWPAVTATLIGSLVALLGQFWAPMRPIYDYAWFVGFGLAAGLYYTMMKPSRAM